VSYDPAAWHDFFVMLGGSAAALTGLVFVALSLHVDRIIAVPFHRFRAGVAVAGLTSMILLSGAVLVPAQSHAALGVEVLLCSAFFVWMNASGGRHPDPALEGRSRLSKRLLYGLSVTALFVVAGVALLVGSGVGFLVLAAGMGASLSSSIKTAWDLMTRLRPAAAGAD
jgi:modulator of FtsH protease